MKIDALDHLVLTVADIETTANFYAEALGMEIITFGKTRTALKFGQQKINLHQFGKEFEPKAAQPTLGSADLCFITTIPLNDVITHLNTLEINIEDGPVNRTGAKGTILSIYIRDPDQNLIEISNDINI